MHQPTILLSTAYFPPIQYITKFLLTDQIWIEADEHFSKQSYRNRTIILSTHGPETLIVPVEKGHSSKQLIRDIRISYDSKWPHNHWQSIISAYHSSPFFELLEEEFRPFFEKRYHYLIDFDQSILEVILNLLEINVEIHRTTDFEQVNDNFINLREAMHPKMQRNKQDPNFKAHPYTQVFEDRFDFIPNLSILDLIFNCGSQSYEMLSKSCNDRSEQLS